MSTSASRRPPSADPAPTIEQLRATLIEGMHGPRHHLERCAARHDLSGQLAIALLQLCAPWPPTDGGAGAVPGAETACDGSGMPMRELAGRISCDPSQVTGIADRLEDLGLVERRPSPQDRRVKLLVVTAGGQQVAAQLAEEVNRDAPGFSALTDQERVVLARLLSKVAAAS
jgi:DNA-binding MarR family transcriptional regulator